MSVLHVAQPTVAGVPRVVAELAADQVRRGWRVGVACPAPGALASEVTRAGAVHFDWRATRRPDARVFPETRALARIIEDFGADVVHLHSAKAGLAGRLAIRGRIPTVFQPHAWSFFATAGLRTATIAWERLAARWASAVVCVSGGERDAAIAEGISAPYVVIPNGVALPPEDRTLEEERRAVRRALRLDGAPIVVCLGRLCRQKGQDVLLRAWRLLLDRYPSAILVLVGDGPWEDRLRQEDVPRVSFAGWQHDPSPWLTAADIVVIPSRWEAGLSIAAMEAMAHARPVVASDVAGFRDPLASGAGCVVPVEDEEALADALAGRLGDPGLARREGLAGRRLVEERYAGDDCLEAHAGLVTRLAHSITPEASAASGPRR